MARPRYELTDRELSIILPLLPNKPCGVPRVDDRRVLYGILWRLRTGSPWAGIPERYGPSTTCYNRFVRWRKAGVWDRLLASVFANLRWRDRDDPLHLRPRPTTRCDGQKGKPADRGTGRARGGLTSKIHASLTLTAVSSPCQSDLRPHPRPSGSRGSAGGHSEGATPLGDRGSDSNAMCDAAAAKSAWANITSRSNPKQRFAFSGWLYWQRNLAERLFNRIRHFRGIVTRYDKCPENYLATVKLICARIWCSA